MGTDRRRELPRTTNSDADVIATRSSRAVCAALVNPIKCCPTIPGEMPERYNTLRESPADAKYKLCVVQFKVPGAKNGGSDKGPDGNRIDSIPIANSVIAAGGACDLIL